MSEKILTEEERNLQLEQGLALVDQFINKNYLINVSRFPALEIDASDQHVSSMRMFRLNRLIFDPEENINDKLVSVYSALQHLNSSVVTVIDSNKDGIRYYIGIRSENNASVAGKVLEQSFCGNFPGSEISALSGSEIEQVMGTLLESDSEYALKNVAAVSVVPSMRDDDKKQFVQGMEKLIDTMSGESYTAVFINKALDKETLETRKRGFEELYSTLSPFVKTSLSYGENMSESVSKGMFRSFADSVNRGVSNATTESTGYSKSTSWTSSSGSSWSGQGYSSNWGSSQGGSTGYTSGSSWTSSVTSGSSFSTSQGENQSKSWSEGTSRTMTKEYQNRSVASLLKKIDENLERIRSSEAFGLWESAAYFVSQDVQTSITAANTYKALVSGKHSAAENSFINSWSGQRIEETKPILKAISRFLHPQIQLPDRGEFNGKIVSPISLISGNEIPFMMGLPKKSVTGLMTTQIAAFGRNIYRANTAKEDRKISLGNVYHMGRAEAQRVELDLNSLTAHCFIAGSTGSGKSNTTYCLLESLIKEKIPFMVIEPAKGEYKNEFGKLEGLHVFGTNPKEGRMLRVNPFQFHEEIHILEHMDMLMEIFQACWPLQAAMPAILKAALEKAYMRCGWDLNQSIHFPNERNKYPRFQDLMEAMTDIIENSSYSYEAKGDYEGALLTRVSSMINGINGQIFNSLYEVSDEILFDGNTVIDLSRVGSTETKSLLMGILVIKLKEYRMVSTSGENRPLSHVTVLEEAHNLLKRTGGEMHENSSNMAAKSVEMICNSIAEMRTYGEGFLIIDQSPTAVDVAAIKNTNTKIIMRLPEQGDCEAIGNALALSEYQKKELSKLTVGIAVVFQNSWMEPVLTKIDQRTGGYYEEFPRTSDRTLRQIKGKLISEMMKQIEEYDFKPDILYKMIESSRCDKFRKEDFVASIDYFVEIVGSMNCGRQRFGRFLMDFLGCGQLFQLADLDIDVKKEDLMNRITLEEIRACQKWGIQCKKNLLKYVSLSEKETGKLLGYLLRVFDAENEENMNYMFASSILYS